MRAIAPVVAGAFLLLGEQHAATAQQRQRDVPTFRASAEMVYVRFHVERKGRYVDDLRKEQVRVLEDGRQQTIVVFVTRQTREIPAPLEVTLLLDMSRSVVGPGLLGADLVGEALLGALDTHARVALWAFAGDLCPLVPPGRDMSALKSGFEQALLFSRETGGWGTRLFASVADVCREAKRGEPARRALVVFSDGHENQGGDVEDAIRAALESDVRVYAVKLGRELRPAVPDLVSVSGLDRLPGSAIADFSRSAFEELARKTQGRVYEPLALDRKGLAAILRDIATNIDQENVVGYQPQAAPAGRRHRVKVELVDKSVGAIKDGERTLVR